MFTKGTGQQRLTSTPIDGEDLFQAIFSQAAIGIAQIGLDGTWLLMNNRFCEMLGYSEAELREKTLQDITHPDDSDESLAGRRQLLTGEISSHTMEKRYIRKDGTICWAKLYRSLVRDRDNLPKYFIAVVEDITEKIQTERARRDSEQRLALAQKAASLAVWDFDLHTYTTVFSGKYARLHGLTSDHPPLTREEWLEIVHPEDRERLQALLRESINQTHFWDTEFRVVWQDGSIHWLLAKGQVLLDDSGVPVRMTGVTLDITDRKQAEAALRESEQRYKEVFDLTSDCIFLLDITPDGRFKFAGFNPAEEKAIGLLSAEVSGRFVEDVLAEDVARKVIANYRRCLELGRLINYEEELDLPMGRRHFQVNLIPARSPDGRIYRIVGVARDITERKRAEADLRESEERFRNMADAAPVMIWVSDSDKLCTFFNKSWLGFTGRNMEEVLGNGWTVDVHPDDLDRCFAIYSSSFDARQTFKMEYRLRRADGEYRWVLDDGVPRFAPAGEFAGYIGSCTDITDLKRTQEVTLSRQKLESLGVVASGIAHDFNNLLGGILGQAEAMEMDESRGSSSSEEIQRIRAATMHGAKIVRELMIYAGQDQASLIEPVDLSRLVEEMLDLLQVSISKHAVLRTNLLKKLPAVRGNASQIRQVVMNLVINASEAIGEKEGVIGITTIQVSGGKNLVSNLATDLRQGDCVLLEVSDTGCGITEEAQAKIFDPFFSTKFAGRGLGLSVVQGIVRSHGGAINLISNPARGTTFQVLLPCTSKEALDIPTGLTYSRAEQSDACAGTILVVEDEEILRLAVSKVLRKKGFSVIEANDGFGAMNLMREHKDNIDAIVLDFTVPGRSSREVLVEAQHMRPDLTMILTSAYGKQTVDAAFTGLRIEHFIRKPFQLDDLVKLLQDALSARIQRGRTSSD